MDISFKFVNYGERFEPAPGTIVLDVGMKTVPGVIDHHHPDAEPECTTSLIIKHPRLVLDHIRPSQAGTGGADAPPLTFITHRLPDFDALASIFLTLKLLETGRIDPAMERIAAYAKMVDSAALPNSLDLAATPYAILRALFSGSKKSEDEINRQRTDEGLRFMRYLYARAAEGDDIIENRKLFAGIDRYERAVHKVEGDYSSYLADLDRGRILRLRLPAVKGRAFGSPLARDLYPQASTAEMDPRAMPGAPAAVDGRSVVDVDGLTVANPRSFLLKEWARRDREHPPDRRGFGFLMTKFGEDRFILGVDPDRGIHLKGLGPRLNLKELEKRTAAGRPAGPPWYAGDNAFFDYRIIDSPRDGTSLQPAEVLDTLLAFGDGHIVKPE